MNTRTYSLDVAGAAKPFIFNINQSDFGRFLAEAQRDANMASHNFLVRTVQGEDKKRLREAFEEDWSLPLQMIAPLQEELITQREVLVKKCAKPTST